MACAAWLRISAAAAAAAPGLQGGLQESLAQVDKAIQDLPSVYSIVPMELVQRGAFRSYIQVCLVVGTCWGLQIRRSIARDATACHGLRRHVITLTGPPRVYSSKGAWLLYPCKRKVLADKEPASNLRIKRAPPAGKIKFWTFGPVISACIH